ncbi:MAG: hypothetical protein LH630_07565 [Actinomycetia bacterium]|nr:hypothetical protein [Actinomycetes bacterium]
MTEIVPGATGPGDDPSPQAYAVGMEVPPQRWARPAEERALPEWQPYYGVRFGRRIRVLLTVLVAVLPALFTLMAIDQLLLARERGERRE